MTVVNLRDRMQASLAAGPDELELFEALTLSAIELKSGGETAIQVYRLKERVPRGVLENTRAAALRAVAAIDAYNAGRTA